MVNYRHTLRSRKVSAVIDMLNKLSLNCNVTLMGAPQLSVVFAPVLFGCPSSVEDIAGLSKNTQLLEKIIREGIERDKSGDSTRYTCFQ